MYPARFFHSNKCLIRYIGSAYDRLRDFTLYTEDKNVDENNKFSNTYKKRYSLWMKETICLDEEDINNS